MNEKQLEKYIKKGDKKYFIADSDYLEFFIDEYFIVNKELRELQ